jgi:hypothetical protein
VRLLDATRFLDTHIAEIKRFVILSLAYISI